MKKFETIANKNGKLLTVLPAQVEEVSFASASAALRKKDIKINGKRVSENVMLFSGDMIEIYLPDNLAQPVKLFEIAYEDANILVVNKLKGIEVCDAENSLEDRLNDLGHIVEACHRIDRNTEGLVIFSKSKPVFSEVTNALKKGEFIKKYYIAEVVGVPPKDATLKAFLLKDEDESQVKIFTNPTQGAVKIVTKFKVLKRTINTSVLEVELMSGKTHQIRAHLAYEGYPIIGDGKYGKNTDNKKFKSKSQLLCAYKLAFEFPPTSSLAYLNGKVIEITPSWMNY